MSSRIIFSLWILSVALLFFIQGVSSSSHSTKGLKCSVKYEEYDCGGGLVCLEGNGTCGHCISDDECKRMNSQYICTFKDRYGHNLPDGGQCIHHHIWAFDWRDFVGGFFLFLSSSIAGSSGLGGGGLFVPILFLINKFNAHEAVPLSKAIILGGAIANFILNVSKRFPTIKNKLLIDYRIAAFMTPSILAGTTLGVTLNVMLPAWLILILLACTLSLTTWRMAKKGIEKFKEELLAAKNAAEKKPLLGNENSLSVNEEEEEEKIPTYKLVPYALIAFLVLIEVFIVIMTLLKGSREGKSLIGVKLCSSEFFGIFAAIFVVVFSLTGVVAFTTYKTAQKLRSKADFVKRSDIVNWTKGNMGGLTVGSFIGGILAGLVGIGGGMVSSPILLEIGVHPQIVVATSTFLILFTSSSTTIQYLILGKLPMWYALFYGILAFFANILGNLFIDWLVKKYKKTYLIILIVGIVVALSALMLGISGVISIVGVIKSGHGATFSSLCDV